MDSGLKKIIYFCITMLIILVGVPLALNLPAIMHAVSNHGAGLTVKDANYKLMKKYTRDDRAHYIYKLSWPFSGKKEYADVRYDAKATSSDSHMYKKVSTTYSTSEPVPDKMNTYKLDDVAKDRRLNDSIRESHRYDGGFAPVFLPISH